MNKRQLERDWRCRLPVSLVVELLINWEQLVRRVRWRSPHMTEEEIGREITAAVEEGWLPNVIGSEVRKLLQDVRKGKVSGEG